VHAVTVVDRARHQLEGQQTHRDDESKQRYSCQKSLAGASQPAVLQQCGVPHFRLFSLVEHVGARVPVSKTCWAGTRSGKFN
jgi:hypothetical protein